jgi:hypothetical protein
LKYYYVTAKISNYIDKQHRDEEREKSYADVCWRMLTYADVCYIDKQHRDEEEREKKGGRNRERGGGESGQQL